MNAHWFNERRDNYLIDETPGRPHALLDVPDEGVAGLQGRVVVQRSPDLVTNVLT